VVIAVIAPVVTGLEIQPAGIADEPVIVNPQDVADPNSIAVVIPLGLAGRHTGRILFCKPRRAVLDIAAEMTVVIWAFAPSRVCRDRGSGHRGGGDGDHGQFLENAHGLTPSCS